MLHNYSAVFSYLTSAECMTSYLLYLLIYFRGGSEPDGTR